MTTTAKPKATRQAFGEALAELGAQNEKIVVLDADLSKSTKTDMFAKKFPERFFEMGIAESNMIGTGAGMALSGYIPFVCSFGAFVSGRYDQIRMSVSYARANVKIIGTHSGVGIGDDGHSQMGLEDAGMMRALPGMTVLQPGDEIQTREMMKWAVKHVGPVYFRLTRQNLMPVNDESYKFSIGKFDILKKGSSGIVVFGTGGVLQECMKACEGKDVTLVNIGSVKPFDHEGVAALAKGAKLFISAEDHYTTSGIGSALAESIAEQGLNVKLKRLGVNEQFGESGEPAELYDHHGISAKKIAETLAKVL